jgi:hypothetical protein
MRKRSRLVLLQKYVAVKTVAAVTSLRRRRV